MFFEIWNFHENIKINKIKMPISIIKGTLKDSDAISDIIRIASLDVAEKFGLTPENAPTHPSNCIPEWIVSSLEKGVQYFILNLGSKPCGCIALEKASPDVCYLERLAVLPEYQKMGFGEALVRYSIDEAKKLGVKRVEIGIIAKHIHLRDWYLKLGFIEKETVQFEHLPFDVTFMYYGSPPHIIY